MGRKNTKKRNTKEKQKQRQSPGKALKGVLDITRYIDSSSGF